MVKWRDRRPSDYDIPSTEAELRRIRRGGDKKGTKPHHVVVMEESELALEKQDHVVEEVPPVLTRTLVRRDWILVGLVCLILILQIWQMVEEKNDPVNTIFPEERRGQLPGKASMEEDAIAEDGPRDGQCAEERQSQSSRQAPMENGGAAGNEPGDGQGGRDGG